MTRTQLIFEKQWLHWSILAVLLAGFTMITSQGSFQAGQLWGISTVAWFWLAVALAVAHQTLVWFCWRTQLHGSLITRTLGKQGFSLYAVLFAVLGISRVGAVFFLAISNRYSINLDPAFGRILAVLLALPALYTFYSVERYFGYIRAVGVDHFDESYRTMPLVRKGIFRFTSNAMYTFGFLLLWVPGLWCGSSAALCAALFNHLYIWVHYYCTESPDMRRIYGTTTEDAESANTSLCGSSE